MESVSTFEKLKKKVETFPDKSGVYMWKDKQGKILYIGKAKVLRNRVRSYLNNEPKGARLETMLRMADDVTWMVTMTDGEALILEDHLIKIHKPKYNIRLKDNKTYPFLALTKNEVFPRLIMTRNISNKKHEYYGPFQSAFDAKKTLLAIHKRFPLRKKNLALDGVKIHKPCLNFHMGKCLAPCAGLINPEDYGQIVKDARRLLCGDYLDLIESLEKQMEAKAENMEFEEAAKIRDQIMSIRTTLQKQRVVSQHKIDRDVICMIEEQGLIAVQVLFIRGGIILSGDFSVFNDKEDNSLDEILRHVISRIYLSKKMIMPKEIVTTLEHEAFEMLSEYATEKCDTPLKIITPKRGKLSELVNICQTNASENLIMHLKQEETHSQLLERTKRELVLNKRPNRIECFDISNISGTSNVASMVVFENNSPVKSDYRKFKVKSFEGSNDFMAMMEVIRRRMVKAFDGSWPLPDLMVIDGGIGQLNSALNVISEFPESEMEVIGLAKGRSEKRRVGVHQFDTDFEYVVKPNRKNPIHFKTNSPALHLLKRIRDEAHRFAISYHRQTRSNKAFSNVLESITGIGPQKKKNLIKHFGGLSKIRKSTYDDLVTVAGITKKDAQLINQFFEKKTKPTD